MDGARRIDIVELSVRSASSGYPVGVQKAQCLQRHPTSSHPGFSLAVPHRAHKVSPTPSAPCDLMQRQKSAARAALGVESDAFLSPNSDISEIRL